MTVSTSLGLSESSAAREWGICAIIIGVIVTFAVPVCLLSAAVGMSAANMQWTDDNLAAADKGSTAGLIVFFVLALLSLVAAIRGLRLARLRGLPAGLAACGLFMSLLAFAVVAVGWFVCVEVKRDVQRIRGLSAPRFHTNDASSDSSF